MRHDLFPSREEYEDAKETIRAIATGAEPGGDMAALSLDQEEDAAWQVVLAYEEMMREEHGEKGEE